MMKLPCLFPKLVSSVFHTVMPVCNIPKMEKSCVDFKVVTNKFNFKEAFLLRVYLIIHVFTAHLLF